MNTGPGGGLRIGKCDTRLGSDVSYIVKLLCTAAQSQPVARFTRSVALGFDVYYCSSCYAKRLVDQSIVVASVAQGGGFCGLKNNGHFQLAERFPGALTLNSRRANAVLVVFPDCLFVLNTYHTWDSSSTSSFAVSRTARFSVGFHPRYRSRGSWVQHSTTVRVIMISYIALLLSLVLLRSALLPRKAPEREYAKPNDRRLATADH